MENIPAGQLVPLFAVTFDSTAAQTGPALLPYKVMLLGQMLTAPSAWAQTHTYGVGDRVRPTVANGHWYICVYPGLTEAYSEPTWPTTSKSQVVNNGIVWQEFPAPTSTTAIINKIPTAEWAGALYGQGSPLHIMARGFKTNNTVTELSAIAAADNSGGQAATGTIKIDSGATAAGSLACYIDGTLVSVAVAENDTAATIATALALAINNIYSLPVWATISASYENIAGDEVTLTAKVKGTVGNDIDVRMNYYSDTDAYPEGVGATIVAMASGATNPDLTLAITALGDQWYQMFVGPWTDSTSMTAIETELARRALYNKKIYGLYVSAKRDTLATAIATAESDLESYGATRNSQWTSILNCNKVPNSPGEFAAAQVAQVAPEASRDPAIPMQTLPLLGILPPIVSDRFTDDANNRLLNAGISTFTVDAGGVVRIQKMITMYQFSPAGAADTSWQSVNTVFNNIYQAYDFCNSLALKFPRSKIVADGTKVAPGQAIITPKMGKAFAIEKYDQWCFMAIATSADLFAANVTCIVDPSNPNRLIWGLPSNLAAQFEQADITIKFQLG